MSGPITVIFIQNELMLLQLLIVSFCWFLNDSFVFSDFLCIWNTNFHTLQAGKEMAGKIYGQVGILWCL